MTGAARRPLPAHRLVGGRGPTVVFLPGYASDMAGTKALALEAWARDRGHAYARFDYAGCGESAGVFADQTLDGWRDDALAIVDLVAGPVVLVGSSMGGWLMLLAALARRERVAALVGIAAAPDFTDWGFTADEKAAILRDGRIERADPYGGAPMPYSRAFWRSGEAHRVMGGRIAIDGPVRLLHGMADEVVPWPRSAMLATALRSADVQTLLVKDGDHRLSREADIAQLLRTVEEVIAACR